MRGEYCVYGASVLSLLSAIFLVFANISQLSSGPLVSSLFFIQMDTFHFGDPFIAGAGGADGVFAGDQNAPMGGGKGIRMGYKYGVYSACGYMQNGAACNSTMFGYPFDPLGNIMADATTDRDIRNGAARFIGDDNLSDSNYNIVISRVANLLIFVGTALCGVALIVGFLKTRVTFLTASISSGLSALLLMIGAAMWSAAIARNSSINTRMTSPDVKIGIVISAGASLYLVWVAFVIQTLACIPYTISFLTFRKQNKASFQYSYPDN